MRGGGASGRIDRIDATAPAIGDRFSWRTFTEGVPRAVWALTVLHVLVLACWSVLVPIYDSPDEPQHVDMMLALQDRGLDYPTPRERGLSVKIEHSLLAMRFSASTDARERITTPVTAVMATPRAERPSFDELGPPHMTTRQPNQMPQHPPLYYALGTALLWLIPDHLAFDQVVGLLRLFNVLLVAPLPLLCHAAARALAGPGALAVTAAAAPLAIPQLFHIGSAVNNDNLLTLLVGLLTVVLVFVARGDTSARTGAIVGLLSGLALFTKGFALVLPVVVGAAYGLGLLRQRVRGDGPRWTQVLGSAGLAAVAAFAIGGWWWVRNVLVHGRIQPSYTNPPLPEGGRAVDVAFLWEKYREGMMQRFWGSFGWVEVNLSETLVLNATRVALLGILLAFVLRRRSDRWWRSELLLLLLPTLTIGAIVWYGAYDWYARTELLGGMQGRYIFPGLVGLATLFALGLTRLLGRVRSVAPLLVIAAAGWLQVIATRAVLFHYYNMPEAPGLRSERISVAALLAWSPWPRAAVLALWALTLAAGVWTGVELLLRVRRAAPPAGPPAGAPQRAADVIVPG